jgi:hypothetical protein
MLAAMRRRGSMEGLSSLLMKAYPGKSKEELQAVRVFGAWSKALSTRIVHNAQPVKLFKGALTVHTATSAWANSLQLESDALLQALQRKAPEVKLRKLFFRVGPLPNAATLLEPEPEAEAVTPAAHLPDDIARELARISDDTLREVVARAAAAGLGEVAQDESRARNTPPSSLDALSTRPARSQPPPARSASKPPR